MKEFVQNILTFTIIITLLRGIVSSPKYQQYFHFFSGVVLILLFLSPVLSALRSDRDWHSILEEKMLQMDLSEIQGEMRVAEEGFEQVLCRRYQKVVEEQVALLARERGMTLTDTRVTLEKEKDGWRVAEVSGRIGEESGREETEAVETVTLGEESIGGQEDSSPGGQALKKHICSSLNLGKEQVHLWRSKK